jgi:hypothetical protein
VVATGDCRSRELLGVARSLHDALRPRDGQAAGATSDALLKELLPLPTHSLEEVQRQFEAARTAFYDGKHSQAEAQIALALRALEQLPPGPQRWATSADLRLVRYLNFHAQRKHEAALAAFTEVLRLDPGHQMDPEWHSPATRAAFDKARKQLAAAPRGKLMVTSSPSGADVFLDGRHVGKTPLSGDFLPGTYQLQLSRSGATSFSREVQILKAESHPVSVDLAFEGSVQPGRPVCVRSRPEEADPLRGVTRIAALLGMREAVVVRLVRGGAGSSMVSAALLNVDSGQQVREGSLKLSTTGDLEVGQEDLVTFLQTGQASKDIVVAERPPAPSQDVASGGAGGSVAGPGLAGLLRSPAIRPSSYVLGGAGLAALAGAGSVWLATRADAETFARRTPGGFVRAEDTQAQELARKLDASSRLTTGLLIGGGAGVLAGTALFLLSGGDAPPPTYALVPSHDGFAFSLQGTLP